MLTQDTESERPDPKRKSVSLKICLQPQIPSICPKRNKCALYP